MKRIMEVICCQPVTAGVGFIKSRKSEDKVMDMSEAMREYAGHFNLELKEIIVDRSSGLDIDREPLDELAEWMEEENIEVVILRSIFDITKDQDDLREFLKRAYELDVTIFSMEHRCSVRYEPCDECCG